jgi:hypothetical protein
LQNQGYLFPTWVALITFEANQFSFLFIVILSSEDFSFAIYLTLKLKFVVCMNNFIGSTTMDQFTVFGTVVCSKITTNIA